MNALALLLVLARVRVTLIDTVIRLEHLIDQTAQGVALEIRIKKYDDNLSACLDEMEHLSIAISGSNISTVKPRVST